MMAGVRGNLFEPQMRAGGHDLGEPDERRRGGGVAPALAQAVAVRHALGVYCLPCLQVADRDRAVYEERGRELPGGTRRLAGISALHGLRHRRWRYIHTLGVVLVRISRP